MQYNLYLGNCAELLLKEISNSYDSMVTDPPAGVSFMGANWDTFGSSKAAQRGGSPQNRLMLARKAKLEFKSSLLPIWKECFRVLKPGAHIFVWALPKTSHWTADILEEAGFEIRDCVYHYFPQGMPKSRNISKDLDLDEPAAPFKKAKSKRQMVKIEHDALSEWHVKYGFRNTQSSLEEIQNFGFREIPSNEPVSNEAKKWFGWGTALRPSMECWWLARKPLKEKTVAKQVLATGTGALNIDACKINGKYPATLLITHYKNCKFDECVPECQIATTGLKKIIQSLNIDDLDFPFLYHNKTSSKEKLIAYNNKEIKNTHPTVKPIQLMRQLVKLVTPPNGTVLDPFCGSGTTGVAALLEGFKFTGFEIIDNFYDLAKIRLELIQGVKHD